MDPDKVKAALEALKADDGAAALALLEEIVASLASGGAPDPAEGAALADAPADPPKPDEATVSAAMCRLTGAATPEEAQALFGRVMANAENAAAASAASDDVKRADLVAELVKLGAEIPATAWEGEPKARKPAKRFYSESLTELSKRVDAYRVARPESREAHPPEGSAPDISTLSKAELDACKKQGMDPAEYIVRKQNAVKRVG